MSCSCEAGMGEIAHVGLSGADDNTGINLFGWDDPNYPQLAGQSTDPGGVSAGNTWNSVWQQGVVSLFNIGGSIAQSRYGGPQPGQYFQNGSMVSYRVPVGANSFSSFPQGMGVGLGSSSGVMTYVLLGGAALLAIGLLKK